MTNEELAIIWFKIGGCTYPPCKSENYTNVSTQKQFIYTILQICLDNNTQAFKALCKAVQEANYIGNEKSIYRQAIKNIIINELRELDIKQNLNRQDFIKLFKRYNLPNKIAHNAPKVDNHKELAKLLPDCPELTQKQKHEILQNTKNTIGAWISKHKEPVSVKEIIRYIQDNKTLSKSGSSPKLNTLPIFKDEYNKLINNHTKT